MTSTTCIRMELPSKKRKIMHTVLWAGSDWTGNAATRQTCPGNSLSFGQQEATGLTELARVRAKVSGVLMTVSFWALRWWTRREWGVDRGLREEQVSLLLPGKSERWGSSSWVQPALRSWTLQLCWAASILLSTVRPLETMFSSVTTSERSR